MLDRVTAMSNLTHKIAGIFVAGFAIAACATDEAPRTATRQSAETCTPGYETCDIGCYEQGGPSTDDCIIRCNATGTDFETIWDCGWAQNFPYSASCLNSQPHPICQNN
jgi:hypothetical protein